MQMFSSTYDSNLLPTFPSSSSSSYPSSLPFLIDPENDFQNNTILDDSLVLPFIPTSVHDAPFPHDDSVANLPLSDCTQMLEQEQPNSTHFGTPYGSISNFLTQKPPIAKKDRHSKIHTSQGLRDRRVRLSSEIARKFFDLQDMLEFDKPSNTLEWLFTKSENAIKELARSKNSSCSPCEPNGVEYSNQNKSLVGGEASKGRNKLKWGQREDVCVQITKKESRERARARARERTCYKMQQELEEITRCPVTGNAQTLHQLRPQQQQPPDQPCTRWRQILQPNYPHHHYNLLDNEAPREYSGFNVIEESIMIKRNLKPSLVPSHSQNLAIIPKEASFSNNNNVNDYPYPIFPYSTPNWDANASNFCGIATMNFSSRFMNQW